MGEFNIFSFFTNPNWLFALVPVFLSVFLLRHSGYIVKTYVTEKGESLSTRVRLGLPLFFFLISACFMVVALADPTEKYVVYEEELKINRILVAIDNSSSMYNFNAGDKTPIYCTDDNLEPTYPRIYVACQALHHLVNSVSSFSKKRKTAGRDTIGLVRFALYSKVQTYPTGNYSQLRDVVDRMNWRRVADLGIHTEIHLGLWDLYLLALKRSRDPNTDQVYLNEQDITSLARALFPSSSVRAKLHLRRNLKEKLTRLKNELQDTAFIIFTDAHKGQLESRFNKNPVSFKKMMDLGEFLGLPICFLRVF